MFSIDPRSHHLEAWPDAPLIQMGQPTDRVFQRQLTDNLPSSRGDVHGLEREVQFADLDYREMQAMG
ncbi:MAG: hypothetical protein EOO23_00850 [Comamonadaceae bacterium]|nr:MAG: hypothetical protein EOO23_00850 [Comamonadaceae bacterium]